LEKRPEILFLFGILQFKVNIYRHFTN